jgi:hypothetical protein
LCNVASGFAETYRRWKARLATPPIAKELRKPIMP